MTWTVCRESEDLRSFHMNKEIRENSILDYRLRVSVLNFVAIISSYVYQCRYVAKQKKGYA